MEEDNDSFSNPSAMSHVSLGTNDFIRAAVFYDKVLATLGIKRIMEHEHAIAYGKIHPEFWIVVPLNDEPASAGNGTHVGFMAQSPDAVNAFHKTAIDAGATNEGAPGARLEYGEPYYGCFVRDPDGHKIEATYWDTELAASITPV